MRWLFLAIALPAMAQGPWHPLFNGRDLEGWQIVDHGGRPAFTVEDGAIRTQPGRGMLWYTDRNIGNATIRVIYRMSAPSGNSGVFVRIPGPPPDENWARNRGIEVQIDDRDDDWHCTGVLYSMTKALARPTKPAGEWNTMDIVLRGLRTIVRVNGVLVTDYDGTSPVPSRAFPWEPARGPRPEVGFIGLQHHDDKAVIWFREINVRRN
jgi:hypothetical protein